MDKIHFLNTGHSDCIIIESDGHFAMVDAAEDNDYPADKPSLKLKGYEDVVVDYLLKNCKGEDGIVTLDFVMGTHAHSDHIGGFDTVILHPQIDVKKAYLKPYNEDFVNKYEVTRWDNKEVYEQMVSALNETNTPIVSSFDNETFALGNFKITFLNGTSKKRWRKFGENVNSVVALVEKCGTRVLLAGDMNYKAGDERRVASKVGKIDILKVGHHGYTGSTSTYLAKKLHPTYSIVTNRASAVNPDVRFKLKKIAKSEILATADLNGIIALIDDNGNITLKKDIM